MDDFFYATQYFKWIVFDPAWTGKNLTVLFLCLGLDFTFRIEQDTARAGRSLIDGCDQFAHRALHGWKSLY